MSLTDIEAANLGAHARFIETLEDALVAFTALDGEAALRSWAELARRIGAHQVVEEELLGVVATHEGTAPPRGGATALVIAEHRQLDKLHALATQRIELVHAAPIESRRLAMVRGLDDLLRFRHLLEHHGLREERIVYPHVAVALPHELRAGFAERLART